MFFLLATPVLKAVSATAKATLKETLGSKLLGIIYCDDNYSSETKSAIAFDAAKFISKLIVEASTSIAPLKIPLIKIIQILIYYLFYMNF